MQEHTLYVSFVKKDDKGNVVMTISNLPGDSLPYAELRLDDEEELRFEDEARHVPFSDAAMHDLQGTYITYSKFIEILGIRGSTLNVLA